MAYIMKIIFRIIAILIVAYTFIGFVLAPYLIQSNFSKTLKTFTSANGYLEKVYINPYTFEVELTNLLIQDKNNINIIYFRTFSIDFEITSIFKDTLVLNHILLTNCKTNIILDKNGDTNFQYILNFLNKDNQEEIKETNSTAQTIPLKINDIKLTNNKIVFIDNSKAMPFDIKTKEFDINIQNLSIVANDKGNINIDIDITDTARLKLDSSFSLNPIAFEGNFSLNNLRIDKISTYIKDDIDFDLSGERINLDFNYKVNIQDETLNANISDINTLIYKSYYSKDDVNLALEILTNTIESLNIKKQQDLLDIKLNGKLSFEDLKVVKTDEIVIDKIDTNLVYDVALHNDKLKVLIDDVQIDVNDIEYKNKTLNINLPKLTNTIKSLQIKKQQDLLDIKLNGKLSFDDLKVVNTKDIDVAIDKIDSNLAYAVDLHNDKLKAIIDDVKIYVDDVQYKSKTLNINLPKLTNTIEQIIVNQSLKNNNTTLLTKNIKVFDAKIIASDLSKAEPIILKINNIVGEVDKITLDKSLPIETKLSFDTPMEGKISTVAKIVLEPLDIDLKLKTTNLTVLPYLPYIQDFVNIDIKSGYLNSDLIIKLKKQNKDFVPNIKADISLDDIDIFHSLTNQRLASFKQLKVDKLNFKTDDLNIQKITLDNSYIKFAIAKDATTNFDNITKDNTQKAENKTKKEDKSPSTFKYLVKEFELKDSKSDFSDFSLPLQFATKIHSLKANIKDISSNDIDTNLKLDGIVDEHGMATISGALNMANYKKQTNIKVDFENLDITSFSPYSTKFIGNKIDTGKLWLDLEYIIQDSQLSSTNNMRIKDLTLGEKIKSKDAVNLPIGLFIALLEDSDGFIEVDVPVKGDIDNPEFQLGGAIWSAVGNIVTNIVTSPFRFLGSLLGISSDELGNMEFDYGMAIILPPQKEKLNNLAKVFNKKPKLSLVLTSTYDSKNDLKFFQVQKLNKRLNVKKKKQSLENIFIKAFGLKQFERIKKENIKQSKLINGILKNKLIPTMKIDDKILEDLAVQRSDMIKKYLITKGLKQSRIKIKPTIEHLISKDKKRINIKLNVDIK